VKLFRRGVSLTLNEISHQDSEIFRNVIHNRVKCKM
jgi:hypothetical protein